MTTTSIDPAPQGVMNVSRRGFLGGLVGAGSFVLGASWPLASARAASVNEAFAPNVFLAIAPSGVVTIIAHRSEMGTGIRTSLPMVVADELGALWERVTIEQAPGDRSFGSQNTDGSRSIRRFYDVMRVAGASARNMLERAAAARWNVAHTECTTRGHEVVHESTNRTLPFGDLVADAIALDPPAAEDLRYRTRSELNYVGKGVPITDGQDIVTGRATFGIDATLPGMKYASIERPPVLGGTVRAYDATATLAVPGVERVIELSSSTAPHAFKPLGGLAVIGTSTWATLRGRQALEVEWDDGANASYSSETYDAALLASAQAGGRVVRDEGDVDAAFADATRTVEANYELPLLSHAPMEPPCALARVTDDLCEVWAPTQNPQTAQDMLAGEFGLSRDQVVVHVTLLGGGFGRKSKADFVVEAARLAREVGAPVKVTWTREDDVRHDYYHAVSALSMKAALNGDDDVTALRMSTAFPSISTTFDPTARHGSDGELGQGFSDVPFAVPNIRVENGEARGHVRIGWLRSVANIYHAFGVSTFVDELAAARGRDPFEHWLSMLGTDRDLALGDFYSNYGEPLERYPYDIKRLRAVGQLAADRAEWGRDLPRGRGLGFAAHRSFLASVAVVAEVDVTQDGQLTIPRIDMAVDCGLAVHPDRVRSQMEGAAVFGAGVALAGEITAKDGRIEQSNFHDYKIPRIYEAPQDVRVHLVESGELPGGVGEPGVPPIAPAICNAVFAATGKRIRRLPLARHDLSWS